MIVNIHEAKTNFSKLIARFLEGEKIIIAKNGEPILQFSPVEKTERKLRSTGFFNCEIDMSAFDGPIEEMREYE
ncbi:Antitoxin of toxin-antitoxin stability system [uncultured Desulfobacterium sp.]|uniref:Antitoxin n=1 Tax=uncultured Desulfobacterium sp. TaxID=201089 RepID=A0A445MT41_9BACT|nr:Antitoxin of toxin-antitoxin stability system [uncultured Desulfobacterium sp.]